MTNLSTFLRQQPIVFKRDFLRIVVILIFVLIIKPATLLANPLPIQEVFIPSVSNVDNNNIALTISVKSGYYIYKSRTHFSSNDITIINTVTSAARTENDPYFGKQEIWESDLTANIAYKNNNNLQNATLIVSLQGCKKHGICYPPTDYKLPINLSFAEKNANQTQLEPSKTANSANPSSVNINKNNNIFNSTPNSDNSSSIANQSTGDNLLSGKTIDNQKLLPEDQAFSFAIETNDSKNYIINWVITDNYYLYRNKINVELVSGDDSLETVRSTDGTDHEDAFFGKQQIYYTNNNAKTYLTFDRTITQPNILKISYQGCATIGVCYSKIIKTFDISQIAGDIVSSNNLKLLTNDETKQQNAAVSNNSANNLTNNQANSIGNNHDNKSFVNAQDKITKTLLNNPALAFLLLLIAGIALTFTPCVLPMLPILLGILNNQKQASKSRTVFLATCYVLGMAIMMAVFGLIVASTNINIQAIFQNPVLLIIFALIFVIMAIAMFGLFTIAIPSSIQTKINSYQNQLPTDKPIGLLIMGALSTLVVGPCVAPPLIAILVFISTTNNTMLGGLYLFTLGLGMGLPLIVFASLFNKLPRTGNFSKLINKLFALLMLVVAAWLISRILPERVSMVIWGLLALGVASVLYKSKLKYKLSIAIANIIAIVFIIIGFIWIGAASIGHGNLFNPFAKKTELNFEYINNMAQLDQAIKSAKKPIMLDLYADWCVSCQELEKVTFLDEKIHEQLKTKFKLLKLDITKNTLEQQQIMKQYQLIGPPVLIFIKNAKEMENYRVVGAIDKAKLQEILQEVQK